MTAQVTSTRAPDPHLFEDERAVVPRCRAPPLNALLERGRHAHAERHPDDLDGGSTMTSLSTSTAATGSRFTDVGRVSRTSTSKRIRSRDVSAGQREPRDRFGPSPSGVARSTQFLLPTEEGDRRREELARRYPVPSWQFTLFRLAGNTEADPASPRRRHRPRRGGPASSRAIPRPTSRRALVRSGTTGSRRRCSGPVEGCGRVGCGSCSSNDADGLESALAPGDVRASR